MITYRKATMDDCLAIATLKGIVWNTTYKGIYPDNSLANYDIPKNQRIFEQIVHNPDIDFYHAMSGRIIEATDTQLKLEFHLDSAEKQTT